MNKQDLIARLVKKKGISKAEEKMIVELTFQKMTNTLTKGDRIEIQGLGTFGERKYRAYKGKNTKTGESIKVKRKKLPFFKVGRELKSRVNFK